MNLDKNNASMFFKRLLKAAFAAFIILLYSVFLIIAIIEYNSNSLDEMYKFTWQDKSIQFKIKTEEVRYRDYLLQTRDSVLKKSNFYKVDSILNEEINAEPVLEYFILKKFTSLEDKIFDIELNKTSSNSFFIELKSIEVNFSLNIEKLNEILKASTQLVENEELIKFGDFIDSSFKLNKKLRYDLILIIFLISAVVLLLLFFGNKIGSKEKEKTPTEKANSTGKNIKKIEKEIKDLEVSSSKIDESVIDDLKNKIKELNEEIKQMEIAKFIKSNLAFEVSRAEKTAIQLYNRSTLMLILGLLIAVIGIFVFYIALPKYNPQLDRYTYITISIRPTLILLFIQTISFYLLRQYRLLIKDYKYFNQILNIKSNFYSVYQILQKKEISENDKILIDSLMKSYQNEITNEPDSQSLDNKAVFESIASLISKVK